MDIDVNAQINALMEKIRDLNAPGEGMAQRFEAVSLAQSVIHGTLGGNHPIITVLDDALKSEDPDKVIAAIRSVVTLYDQGGLKSPRLAIAHEIEGDILDIAQTQVEEAERNTDVTHKVLQLGIAAFLTGAALEDALRRLCDDHGINYNRQRTSISTLQAALYKPSKQIEFISGSENKQITAWGETRNNADHGRFSEITYAEVLAMVIGVRGFIDRHLP